MYFFTNLKDKVLFCLNLSGPVLELRNNQQWYLIGVISFGNDIVDHSSDSKKCNPSMPFYLMNVEKYYDWIKSRIENKR